MDWKDISFYPFIKPKVFENNISIDIDINVAYTKDIVNKTIYFT